MFSRVSTTLSFRNDSSEIRRQREKLSLEYQHAKEIAEEKGQSLIYDNQKEAACEIIRKFEQGTLLVLLIAQPGTGKTGTVLETIYLQTTHPTECTNVKDVHIISGMNDKDWKEQFRVKMLPSFQENIHHRSVLQKHRDEISSIKNGMLITDECHIASAKNMTVSSVMKAAAFNNLNVVKDKGNKMLDVSATPDAVSWDLKAWGDKAAIVRLMPGSSYKGFEVMLNEDRIREAQPFNDYEYVKKWFEFFENRYRNTSKKYFPIRVSNNEYLGNIRRSIVEFGWNELIHNSVTRVDNIDNVMREAPTRHTVILIKEFWRASKRLIRNHVGGSYEQRPKCTNVTSSSQALIARFCDNYEYEGDELNPDLRPIHFGDKKAIETYVEWFNNGCDYQTTDYKSSNIKSKNGYVESIESKVHHSNMMNLNAVDIENKDSSAINDDDYERGYEFFDTLRENNEYAKNHGAKSNVKKYDNKDDNGFMLCSSSTKKVHSYSELKDFFTTSSIGSNMPVKIDKLKVGESTCRRYVCYKDLEDLNSVQFATSWVRRLR